MSVVGNILVVAGALIFATAALGLVRFPDAYTRVSAVGTAGGVGIVLLVSGALVIQPSVPNVAKVVVIVLLQLATSAVGSMAIARSAYLTGVRMTRWSYDELADDTVPPARDGTVPPAREGTVPPGAAGS
ncbi:cation:proton antiporter [Millisia brevis]|uniref:cation:proton antiporter n=1 Tax=Millisia brevis TaxID=264148 RepID=UPI00082A3AC1|nr:monovalent cation/H(+) antiporter subunit G [Millisia brevis]